MDRNREPITPESAVCKTIPVVLDKWVVDFANGIDVAKDHVKVQRTRSDFASRIWDGITGKGARRQDQINRRLIDTAEGSLQCLGELTESLAKSNLAIARVNDSVTRLSDDLAQVADVASDIRKQLACLVEYCDRKVSEFTEWSEKVDARDDADRQRDLVFDKWRAGRYGGLSIAGRCYAALEELRWGRFGHYCRSYSGTVRIDMLQSVKYKAMAQMREDSSLGSSDSRMRTADWIGAVGDSLVDGNEALAYLASEHKDAPFVFAVTHYPLGHPVPSRVPLRCSASRFAEALTEEVFR